MATDFDNLLSRRSAIYAELAALDSTKSGGAPNIAGGGMGTVDHVGYKDGLYRELKDINALIAQAQGPVEISSRAY